MKTLKSSNSLYCGSTQKNKQGDTVQSSAFLSSKEGLEKGYFFTRLYYFLLFFSLITFFSCGVKNNSAQTPVTYNGKVITNKGGDSAYVLFAPANSDTTYLIDKAGNVFHYWVSKYGFTPGM